MCGMNVWEITVDYCTLNKKMLDIDGMEKDASEKKMQ